VVSAECLFAYAKEEQRILLEGRIQVFEVTADRVSSGNDI
jgi:hypothetical protein